MREKLIELLAGSLRYAGDVCGETGDCSKCQYDKYGANCGYAIRADYFIANGVTIATDNNVGHKWIPVTERLPEKNVAVLVYDGQTVDGFSFMDLSFVSKYGVTHWMPLPPAPEDVK